MSIVDFLRARLDEDGIEIEVYGTYAVGHRQTCIFEGGYEGTGRCDCGAVKRARRDIAAKRAIVDFHANWPVLMESPPVFTPMGPGLNVNEYAMRVTQRFDWMTHQEYVKRFGVDPPTAPMLRELARIYRDHPDYDEAWA